MKLKSALFSGAAAIALAAASNASAADLYIGVFGGFSTFEDEINVSPVGTYFVEEFHSVSITNTHTHFLSATYTADFNFAFEDGWVLGAALGWQMSPQVRSEFEVAYRTFDLDKRANVGIEAAMRTGLYNNTGSLSYSNTATFSTNVPAEMSGDSNVWSFMGNVWYDFDWGNSPIYPFVGGGLGLARLTPEFNGQASGTFSATGMGTVYASLTTGFDDDDWVYAYQFGAGLAWDMDLGGTLTAQYRYFGTANAQFLNISVNAESHNWMLGFNVPLNY